MEYNEEDTHVIGLLSQLREADSAYPAELMASRRQTFVKQIAALGIGTGGALAMREGAKAAGGSSIPPIAGTIVEAALIVVIVAEAGFVAFVNRQKILDLYREISGQPTVQQETVAPESYLPLLDPMDMQETEFVETMTPTVEPILLTETPALSETPSPDLLIATEPASAGGTSSSGAQANSTPEPSGSNDGTGNNGNHYGQTPQAERTKEPSGGSNSSGSSAKSR